MTKHEEYELDLALTRLIQKISRHDSEKKNEVFLVMLHRYAEMLPAFMRGLEYALMRESYIETGILMTKQHERYGNRIDCLNGRRIIVCAVYELNLRGLSIDLVYLPRMSRLSHRQKLNMMNIHKTLKIVNMKFQEY